MTRRDTCEACGRRHFSIRSWGDLASIVAIAAVFFGVVYGAISWGLKLEDGQSDLEDRVTALERGQ